MSYSFDGVDDDLTGDLGASNELAYPITIAHWVKYVDHPVFFEGMLSLALNTANDGFLYTATSNADGRFAGSTHNGLNALFTLSTPTSLDNEWFAIVYVARSATDRQVYIDVRGNTATETTSYAASELYRKITVGASGYGDLEFLGNIAEVAIWNSDLSADTADIDDYMAGTSADQIDNASLVGYWPLNTDGGLSDASGNGGPTLTANGAVFDSDHPIITSGGVTPNYNNFLHAIIGA